MKFQRMKNRRDCMFLQAFSLRILDLYSSPLIYILNTLPLTTLFCYHSSPLEHVYFTAFGTFMPLRWSKYHTSFSCIDDIKCILNRLSSTFLRSKSILGLTNLLLGQPKLFLPSIQTQNLRCMPKTREI